jgi:hypothetical protein
VKLVLARLKTAIYSDDEKGNTHKKEGAVKGNQTKWDKNRREKHIYFDGFCIVCFSFLFVFLPFGYMARETFVPSTDAT